MASSLLAKAGQAATPKKGGHFRIGIGHGSTTDSLDPATFENAYTQFTGMGYRGHLTEVAASGEIVPDLCEHWDTPDAATWTFKLTARALSSATPVLDSDDVVASVNHTGVRSQNRRLSRSWSRSPKSRPTARTRSLLR